MIPTQEVTPDIRSREKMLQSPASASSCAGVLSETVATLRFAIRWRGSSASAKSSSRNVLRAVPPAGAGARPRGGLLATCEVCAEEFRAHVGTRRQPVIPVADVPTCEAVHSGPDLCRGFPPNRFNGHARLRGRTIDLPEPVITGRCCWDSPLEQRLSQGPNFPNKQPQGLVCQEVDAKAIRSCTA